MTPQEDHFRKLVAAWIEAEAECRRTHAIWTDACERRRRLAVEKNNAYAEWQAAKWKIESSVITTVGGNHGTR